MQATLGGSPTSTPEGEQSSPPRSSGQDGSRAHSNQTPCKSSDKMGQAAGKRGECAGQGALLGLCTQTGKGNTAASWAPIVTPRHPVQSWYSSGVFLSHDKTTSDTVCWALNRLCGSSPPCSQHPSHREDPQAQAVRRPRPSTAEPPDLGRDRPVTRVLSGDLEACPASPSPWRLWAGCTGTRGDLGSGRVVLGVGRVVQAPASHLPGQLTHWAPCTAACTLWQTGTAAPWGAPAAAWRRTASHTACESHPWQQSLLCHLRTAGTQAPKHAL